MQQVNLWIDDALDQQAVLDSLTLMDSSVGWTVTESRQDSELSLVSPDSEHRHGQHVVIRNSQLAGDTVNAAIMDGVVILPTTLGKQVLSAQLDKNEANFRKLRDNNPKHLDPSAMPPEDIVTDKFKMAAWALHPTIFKKYHLKDLKDIFDSRFIFSLQREIPAYVALVPLDDSYADAYPSIPKSATEHLARVESVKGELEELGINVPKTNMAKNQINLGIPFPGGENRIAQGMEPPTPLFKECAKHVAEVMLRGAAYAYKEDPKAFEESNTRIGVKKDNFQGSGLATTAHAVRQTLHSIALDSPDGLFHFLKYRFPTAAGFRRQSNSGKCRVSFALGEPGEVLRGRVLDSTDLKGKSIFHYHKDFDNPELIVDDGAEGARDRIVDNLWSGQNDATLGVPAYIAAYKDYHYKTIFQQDPETLGRFIPGTPEFRQFWEEGWNDNQWVRDCAAERGCNTFEELMSTMERLGEHIICGDVENFDGNATWEVTKVFFEYLMSPKVLEMVDVMWNSDKIGVYAAADGSPVYYYVACQEDPSMSEQMRKLVRKTQELMSHVPSGMGPTAQAGRGVVPTSLLEIIINLYADTKQYLLSLPPHPHSKFSAMSALMNSAGDDHSMGSLIIWLITGKHPKDVMEEVLEYLPSYKVMKILPEFPKMNAGYLFHEDEDGQLTHITLSLARCFSNTVFPERARSALGLYSSITKYMESVVGSPIEAKMYQLVDIILRKVYHFNDLDHLFACAERDQIWLDNNASELPAVERLSLFLDIPMNDLEWKFTIDELLAMGAPADLINEFRRPIPSELTVNPFNFLNKDLIVNLAAKIAA